MPRLSDWDDTEQIVKAVARAHADPLLSSFGAPPTDATDDSDSLALRLLHLGAAYYKVALVSDVLGEPKTSRPARMRLSAPLPLLAAALDGHDARHLATRAYDAALKLSPDLAEARYALATLARDGGRHVEALAGFEIVSSLGPHPQTPPHAYLVANADWEAAAILAHLGRYEKAEQAYRDALSGLDAFGAHHIQVAKFFRRQGNLPEAAKHYRRCMTYSFRYFPEFILPPLEPPVSSEPAELPSIFDAEGGHVVFRNGFYFLLPGGVWPIEEATLDAMVAAAESSASAGTGGVLPLRRATTIMALFGREAGRRIS